MIFNYINQPNSISSVRQSFDCSSPSMRVLASRYVDASLANPEAECIEAVLYTTNLQMRQKDVHEDVFLLPILIDDNMIYVVVSRSKSVLVFALLHSRSLTAPGIRRVPIRQPTHRHRTRHCTNQAAPLHQPFESLRSTATLDPEMGPWDPLSLQMLGPPRPPSPYLLPRG